MSKIKVRVYRQVGDTTVWIDQMLDAKLPGWRKSKKGNLYFENRKNRSDAKGKKV